MNEGNLITVTKDQDAARLHAKQAEEAALGAMLRSEDAVTYAAEHLTPKDFKTFQHSTICEAILNLYGNNYPSWDYSIVSEELKRMGQLEAIGGQTYLALLEDNCPNAKHIEKYTEDVLQASLLRQIIKAQETTFEDISKGEIMDANQLLDLASKRLFEVGAKVHKQDFADPQVLATDVGKTLKEAFTTKRKVTGLATGFTKLDNFTGGLLPGNLIILAANASMGKTAFAMNVAENVAFNQGLPVAFFSLEMSKEELILRNISSMTGISTQALRSGEYSQEGWEAVEAALETIENSKLYIDDTAGISAMEVRSKVRRIAKKNDGVALIVVDYLQLCGSANKGGMRVHELDEITAAFKKIAREYKAPLIALSQLNRDNTKRDDKRPMLNDLRDSGAIEQHADMVAFIHREAYYHKKELEMKEKKYAVTTPYAKQKKEEEERTRVEKTGALDGMGQPDVPQEEGVPDENEAEIILSKQRQGPVGIIRIGFNPDRVQFYNKD